MYQTPLKRVFQITFSPKVKVTLLFLISLGVPSAFLLFLAIRGIENDQALAELKLLSEHKTIANSLATEVDKEISLVEEELMKFSYLRKIAWCTRLLNYCIRSSRVNLLNKFSRAGWTSDVSWTRLR